MDETHALLVLKRGAGRATLATLAITGACLLVSPVARAADADARADAGTRTGAGAGTIPEGWAAATAPDSTALVSGDWRLSSPVFSDMPAGGYQIRFVPGGRVSSENLAGVTGWTMVGGRLLLYDARRRITYQFQWSDEAGRFERHLDPDEAGAPAIDIVRFDHPSALEVKSRADVAAPFVLPDAVIGTADDARRIGLQAYFRAGGVRALESVQVGNAFGLGADVPGFAHRGDVVWEVRIHETTELSAIIWVHTKSGASWFLFPRAEAHEAGRGR